MITSITISQLSHKDDQALISASVVMEIYAPSEAITKRAQFLCHVTGEQAEAPATLATSLAREALRQARRLPDGLDLVENEAFLPENITVAA